MTTVWPLSDSARKVTLSIHLTEAFTSHPAKIEDAMVADGVSHAEDNISGYGAKF